MKNYDNINQFKLKALQWATQFDVCCLLDSNQYTDQFSEYDFVIAADAAESFTANHVDTFNALKEFYQQHKNWLFGFLNYDLKNELENLSSSNIDYLNFPLAYFFIPKYLIACKNGEVEILIGPENLLNSIDGFNYVAQSNTKLNIQQRIAEKEYLLKIEAIKRNILRGDIYEMNFCQEFFAEQATIDPVFIYNELKGISPTPFAGFFKHNHQYILSASPERYLCKRDRKIISQPIKGTAKRSLDELEDIKIKTALRNDLKEQSENVMIVDLVRNDLTKSAKKGSVKVDELFGIYSFPQVHQMISTISCELDENVHFIDAIKNAFPMGSMTGAPKLKAMELIENYEVTKRGMYSGSFGYINPNGDFDFNVVIRSILYNKASKYLSFQVGGAITYQSEAQKEYDECLLKASAILKVLS